MRPLDRMLDLPQFRHQLDHVSGFLLKLPLVADVLILAAAATLIERTFGLNPVRRSFHHFDQIRIRVVLKIPKDPRFHPLPGDDVGHHDDPAIDPADPMPRFVRRSIVNSIS